VDALRWKSSPRASLLSSHLGREADVLRRLARGEISISDASPPEINQTDVQPRFNTLANDFMGDSLWAMLFCELLPGGLGGPATTGMDLDTWIDHCLRYHDGRFAKCIDFIFFCYSLKQRKKLNGIVATAARTRSGS
jgi:hypothetical protein